MVLHLITGIEIIEINPLTITIEEAIIEPYDKLKDPKWIKFCREHNFSYTKDANSKFYDLYLRLCAEGLL